MTEYHTTGNGAITVHELNSRITALISGAPALRNVWVVGETSDLRVNPHCYFELIEKDANGDSKARIRAICWASQWRFVAAKFESATGARLTSGMKVMMLVSVNYHPSYGMSVLVSDVDPTYTIGDAVRRRNEILQRLNAEGLLERQRSLMWPMPATRTAVVSARGAAGYGDFINQLFTNSHRIKFEVKLFPAVMQGERTVPTVMDALTRIAADADNWDGVVIIRGGGATTDLEAFDNYGLAAAIANFPLPVIVGIGHERDITVLDYVANMRVKTPTAAAEWLINRGRRMLDALDNACQAVLTAVQNRIASDREQLARLSATVPGAVKTALAASDMRLQRAALTLSADIRTAIEPRRHKLDALAQAIPPAVGNVLYLAKGRLNAYELLVGALSPDKILNRGFTVTCDSSGRPVRDASALKAGQEITTYTASGSAKSRVTETSDNKLIQSSDKYGN